MDKTIGMDKYDKDRERLITRCKACGSSQIYTRQQRIKEFKNWYPEKQEFEIISEVKPAQRVCRQCGFVEDLEDLKKEINKIIKEKRE